MGVEQTTKADERSGVGLERWRQEHLGRLLLMAFQIFERDMLGGLEAAGIRNLRLSHFAVLRNTDLSGSSITEIARRAGLSKQAIGPLVHELVDAGVLSLEPDPRDGRAWRARFTAAGRRGLQTARSVYADLLRRYGRSLGRKSLEQLLGRLAQFVAAAEAPTE